MFTRNELDDELRQSRKLLRAIYLLLLTNPEDVSYIIKRIHDYLHMVDMP